MENIYVKSEVCIPLPKWESYDSLTYDSLFDSETAIFFATCTSIPPLVKFWWDAFLFPVKKNVCIYSFFLLLFLYFYFLLLFEYSCLHFPPPTFTPTLFIPASYPRTYPLWLFPCVLHTCSLMTPTLSPITPLPSPLWLLSGCSLFQCLWLYFACLYILY